MEQNELNYMYIGQHQHSLASTAAKTSVCHVFVT